MIARAKNLHSPEDDSRKGYALETQRDSTVERDEGHAKGVAVPVERHAGQELRGTCLRKRQTTGILPVSATLSTLGSRLVRWEASVSGRERRTSRGRQTGGPIVTYLGGVCLP